MVHKWSITIPELTDEDRNVYVYLPESCRQYPDKRYPVLYMFDGHNVFFDSDATYGKCWGMKEYMDYTDTQMIIAAVECSHTPDNASVCGDDVMAILIDDVVRTSHINLPIRYSPSYVIFEIIPNFVKDRTLSVAERTIFTKWRTIS